MNGWSGYNGPRGFAGYGTPPQVAGVDLIGDDAINGQVAAAMAKGNQWAKQGFPPAPQLYYPPMPPAGGYPQYVPGAELSGVSVRDTGDNGVMRRLMIALPGRVVVAANTTVIVEVRPQRAIRFERLLLEQFQDVAMPTVDTPLLLSSLTVGAEPLIVNTGAIPLRAFKADAVGNVLRGYTAYPGITIAMSVQNPTSDNWSFGGTIIGEAIGAPGT